MERLFFSAKYFYPNSIYPFTLQVTGIKIKSTDIKK